MESNIAIGLCKCTTWPLPGTMQYMIGCVAQLAVQVHLSFEVRVLLS